MDGLLSRLCVFHFRNLGQARVKDVLNVSQKYKLKLQVNHNKDSHLVRDHWPGDEELSETLESKVLESKVERPSIQYERESESFRAGFVSKRYISFRRGLTFIKQPFETCSSIFLNSIRTKHS